MGKYRTVPSLRVFAGCLHFQPDLSLVPASDFARHGAGPVLCADSPELPARLDDKMAEYGPNGGPLLKYAMLRSVIEQARERGSGPVRLPGHEGVFMRVELGEGYEVLEYDAEFEQRVAAGEVVREPGLLYFKVRELMN